MSDIDVAAPAADDDFDLAAALGAEFDKAEAGDIAPEPVKEETASEAAERARDEKGRFAAKTEEPEPAPAAKAAVAEPAAAQKVTPPSEAAPAVSTEPAAVDANKAPPGWSPTAKMAFAELPADHPIRQAVAQREIEIDKGFAKLAEYKPIERFVEMARQSGTTLDKALENYIGIENTLRADFAGGIAQICQRQGIHPIALANQILARNGVSPSQPGETGATQAHQTGPSVDLTPLQQEIAALKSYVHQQQQSGVQSEIQRFASDPKNAFFENVKTEMGRLIDSGFATDLADAYDKACWANAEIRGLLIKQQTAAPSDASAKAAAATQARQASKSITGSPVSGASGKATQSSLEDEIRELMNAGV